MPFIHCYYVSSSLHGASPSFGPFHPSICLMLMPAFLDACPEVVSLACRCVRVRNADVLLNQPQWVTMSLFCFSATCAFTFFYLMFLSRLTLCCTVLCIKCLAIIMSSRCVKNICWYEVMSACFIISSTMTIAHFSPLVTVHMSCGLNPPHWTI